MKARSNLSDGTDAARTEGRIPMRPIQEAASDHATRTAPTPHKGDKLPEKPLLRCK